MVELAREKQREKQVDDSSDGDSGFSSDTKEEKWLRKLRHEIFEDDPMA